GDAGGAGRQPGWPSRREGGAVRRGARTRTPAPRPPRNSLKRISDIGFRAICEHRKLSRLTTDPPKSDIRNPSSPVQQVLFPYLQEVPEGLLEFLFDSPRILAGFEGMHDGIAANQLPVFPKGNLPRI